MFERMSIYKDIMSIYEGIVEKNHPDHIRNWPLLNGLIDVEVGEYAGTQILIFRHVERGNKVFSEKGIGGDINKSVVKEDRITDSNKQEVRLLIKKYLDLNDKDGILFLSSDISLQDECYLLMKKHEKIMGIKPNKIFLSHKSTNKDFVRSINNTLKTMGYLTWFDEDSMNAGANLNRAIMEGFAESCAVVFFITPEFKDEKYIASEIDHATEEKLNRPNEFEIITITVGDCSVPKMLKKYVWKQVSTEIEALTEILKALPIKIREIY